MAPPEQASSHHSLPRRPLGDTGLAVSVLGLGTVKLGRDQGVKYPGAFTIPGDGEARALLDLARDTGINLVDTAPAYGNSEERLGRLLRGQRRHWLIATKVGEEFEHGRSFFDFSPQHIRFSIERSLRRLATDHLDIVLVHSDGNDEAIIRGGALEVLAELKAEGKIRATGMSTKTPAGGLLAASQSDCVMVTWNLAFDGDLPVIDYCHRHGTGVLIKKALASGHATLSPGEDPVGKSFNRIFSHPGVSSAVIGTINPRHLKANVTACLQALPATPGA